MIAVTFALKSESSDFVRIVDHHSLPNREIAVWHTGVGEKTTRARLANFLRANPPHLLISSGFAGALHNAWQPGELLIAENFSSPNVYPAARMALPNARSGRLQTIDAMVDSPTARAELARAHHADAVDMETAFIADACAARGIPMLSLRGISDTPAYPFPAPPAVLFDVERQRTNLPRLFFHVATHPASLGGFIKFVQQIAQTRAALADALQRLLASRCFGQSDSPTNGICRGSC